MNPKIILLVTLVAMNMIMAIQTRVIREKRR
jgi:hypothetical protein